MRALCSCFLLANRGLKCLLQSSMHQCLVAIFHAMPRKRLETQAVMIQDWAVSCPPECVWISRNSDVKSNMCIPVVRALIILLSRQLNILFDVISLGLFLLDAACYVRMFICGLASGWLTVWLTAEVAELTGLVVWVVWFAQKRLLQSSMQFLYEAQRHRQSWFRIGQFQMLTTLVWISITCDVKINMCRGPKSFWKVNQVCIQ